MSDERWTVTISFTASDADAAVTLRETLRMVAENARGLSDVDVEGEHPDGWAWANLTGQPGDGTFIKLGPP